jgi:hypothetical protein
MHRDNNATNLPFSTGTGDIKRDKKYEAREMT